MKREVFELLLAKVPAALVQQLRVEKMMVGYSDKRPGAVLRHYRGSFPDWSVLQVCNQPVGDSPRKSGDRAEAAVVRYQKWLDEWRARSLANATDGADDGKSGG